MEPNLGELLVLPQHSRKCDWGRCFQLETLSVNCGGSAIMFISLEAELVGDFEIWPY